MKSRTAFSEGDLAIFVSGPTVPSDMTGAQICGMADWRIAFTRFAHFALFLVLSEITQAYCE